MEKFHSLQKVKFLFSYLIDANTVVDNKVKKTIDNKKRLNPGNLFIVLLISKSNKNNIYLLF